MANLVSPSSDNQCNNVIRTKKDKQMKAVLDLKSFGARIVDCKEEIENIYNVLNNPNSTSREKKSSLHSIKKTILPFLEHTANACSVSAKILSPIPSLDYVHRGKEYDMKQCIKKLESNEKNKYKSDQLKKLEKVLSSEKPPTQICMIQNRPNRVKSTVKLPTDASNIPQPANGSQYTQNETIKLLDGYPETSKKKSHLINHLVASNLVPITRDGIYRLLRRKKAMKRIREDWGQTGRSKVLGKPEAEKLIKKLKTHHGLVITADDVLGKINETRIRQADEMGLVPITSNNYKPCKSTLNNYLAEIANSDGVHIATSVTKKTTSRYTAENSLISSMCLVVLVAATHFIVVKQRDQEIEKMLTQTTNNGVKLMFNLVSKCNRNLPVIPLLPEYVYSSDVTTAYCYEGKGERKASFVLVGSSTMAESGSRS